MNLVIFNLWPLLRGLWVQDRPLRARDAPRCGLHFRFVGHLFHICQGLFIWLTYFIHMLIQIKSSWVLMANPKYKYMANFWIRIECKSKLIKAKTYLFQETINGHHQKRFSMNFMDTIQNAGKRFSMNYQDHIGGHRNKRFSMNFLDTLEQPSLPRPRKRFSMNYLDTLGPKVRASKSKRFSMNFMDTVGNQRR